MIETGNITLPVFIDDFHRQQHDELNFLYYLRFLFRIDKASGWISMLSCFLHRMLA